MAIIQISRIQHRRGLQEDLPNLAAAELGWSVDSQKLYIGNGTLAEGAPEEGQTEILTENSDLFELVDQYQFKGLPAGFIANTSGDGQGFRRTLQEKLDDMVNVRDFGAKGDGSDDTDALQRAVRYMISYQTSIQGIEMHRTLYLPAGVYKVSSTIYIPPFIRLQGDGKENTIIQMDETANLPLIRLTDNNGAYGGNLGNVTTGRPEARDYIFSDIGFENTSAVQSALLIDGGSDIFLLRCKFEGNAANSEGAIVKLTGDGPQGELLNQRDLSPTRVFFDRCDFINHYCGVETVKKASNLLFNECVFRSLTKDTQFSDQTTGVVFKTPITDSSSTNLVDRYGSRNVTIGYSESLDIGTTQTLSVSASEYNNLVLDYVMTYDTNQRRVGKFTVAGNGTEYFFQDDYVETSSYNGITLNIDSDGNVVYTSDIELDISYTASFYN